MITPLSGTASHGVEGSNPNVWELIFEHYFIDNPEKNPVFPRDGNGLTIFGVDMTITPHIITIWAISLVMIVVFVLLGRYYSRGIIRNPSRPIILFEMVIGFVRDEILKPFLGKRTMQFLPYFMTLFMFLLIANLWGNIPIPQLQQVATANFAVTTVLMLITFVMVNTWGIYRHGPIGYLGSFAPKGVNPFIAGFIWFFEFLSLFIRHAALTIRLFANMVGGHITVFAILYLIVQFQTFLISIGAVPFAIAIILLELFVALLQAYIFTLLSAVFIGLAGEAEH
jgi:F-type H+-transporting ATPase subunit a